MTTSSNSNQTVPFSSFPQGGHIHIVGIGGAGMSAIARVLLDRGYQVSGSDRQTSAVAEALAHDGATLHLGHAAENVAGADVVLISSAVPTDNPEIIAAHEANIPVLKRREALGALTAGYNVIAVAGTHGKTTTSALITHLLIALGADPTYIVGGTLLNTGTNAGVGQSKWFVIEADEYDYMFLGLQPKIAVITNIEHDHPDMFPTLDDVIHAFRQFAANIRADGLLITNGDDPNLQAIIAERAAAQQNTQLFRLADYPQDLLTSAHHSKTEPFSRYAGNHNRLNLLAALTILKQVITPDPAQLAEALRDFRGVARRMELLGTTAHGAAIYSDYGHHPTAIRATLQGARAQLPDRTIWAVWQPHTYSRTHLLAHEFAQAFSEADHALITDIYAAREQPTPGPTPLDIAKWALAAGHKDVRASGNLQATAAILRRELGPNDVVIIFSAGDAPQVGSLLMHDS
jgi:UDP-N-acetylmuramate--alanine ligase